MAWRAAVALGTAMVLAGGWPALAEANGDHFQVGDLHLDPLIGWAVAAFVGLITLMFVAQWIRFNAARRRAGEAGAPEKAAREIEEGDNEYQ